MTEATSAISTPESSSTLSLSARYRVTLLSVLRSPATWCFTLAWICAVICLVLTNHAGYLRYAIPALALVLLCALLSIALTREQELPEQQQDVVTRSTIWTQIAFLGGVIVLTTLLGMALHNVHLPLSIFPSWFLSALPLIEPLLYCVIPWLFLSLTGARRNTLGLRKGYHAWRIIAMFLVVRLLFGAFGWLSLFYATPFALIPLVRAILLNALENGFFEEFLFRGALQTRLSRVITPAWALVISSLLFGLWHIGVMTQTMGGDYLAGAAGTIVNQGVLGLLFGILFYRTRSLLATSIIHIISNTLI